MIRLAAPLLLVFLLLAACARDNTTVAGKYTADKAGTEVVLTLGKDGKGTWSTDLDEIPFKWTLRENGKLWLHTRTGGVIQGTVADGTIHLVLPGVGDLDFRPL